MIKMYTIWLIKPADKMKYIPEKYYYYSTEFIQDIYRRMRVLSYEHRDIDVYETIYPAPNTLPISRKVIFSIRYYGNINNVQEYKYEI